MPLNTVRQTIVETLEAPRLTNMGRRDFSNFKKRRVDYERRLKEHNTQNGTSAPMTGYKCSIDESVLEQFVLLGMVPVANLEDITEEHLQECVQNEAKIIPEQYDLHQIERDIRDAKMSSNRSESLKTRVRLLSLAYGRKLRNMGYANLVLNRGRLAIRHIYRRIVHSQLKNSIHGVMELHKENGFNADYKKFMRKLLEEAEAIDKLEVTSGSSLHKTLQSSDESERSDDDTRRGGKPKTWRGARTRNGKRKHIDKATNDGRKVLDINAKKPDNTSNTNAEGKKAKPQCLNPRCAGFHFVDKCPISTAEDKKSLKEEYFKSKRGRAVNALGDNKKVNSSDPPADTNTSLFNVTFCDGKLELDLLADQGSGADIMPKTILNKILSLQPNLQHEHLDIPIQLSTFDEKGASIVCRSELVADVMIHIRHGTTLSLRGMRWLICDQDAEYVVLGRQTLDRLGLNNRTMLAAACDRFRGVVNLPQLGNPGADATTEEEQRRSCCSLQHRLAYSEHALFHSDGGMESDNLDDTQVYIDLGEDPVEELRQELWTRVEEAKEGGLSPTGANRLEDLLEEHLSIFD